MDWKVSLGLNNTPNIREKEFVRSAVSADAIVGLAMSFPPGCDWSCALPVITWNPAKDYIKTGR
jgi:hypothetical protein